MSRLSNKATSDARPRPSGNFVDALRDRGLIPRRTGCSWLLAGGLASSSAGCFIEIAEAPGFRFTCSNDDDCDAAEACIDDLCQVPCTSATFAEACPEDGSYLTCFNGVCAAACQVGADACSSPNECVGLDPSGESSIGVCGKTCDPEDTSSCPMGELCVFGSCFQACDVADPEACDSSSSCVEGICVPSSGDGGFP